MTFDTNSVFSRVCSTQHIEKLRSLNTSCLLTVDTRAPVSLRSIFRIPCFVNVTLSSLPFTSHRAVRYVVLSGGTAMFHGILETKTKE